MIVPVTSRLTAASAAPSPSATAAQWPVVSLAGPVWRNNRFVTLVLGAASVVVVTAMHRTS